MIKHEVTWQPRMGALGVRITESTRVIASLWGNDIYRGNDDQLFLYQQGKLVAMLPPEKTTLGEYVTQRADGWIVGRKRLGV